MSSPVGSPIHSTCVKREGSSLVENTTTTGASSKPLGENMNDAWQESSSRNSSSLGCNVALRVSAFTGGFSSEEDSDFEGGDDLNTSRGITRGLGRKAMSTASDFYGRRSRLSNIVPVSERSAAYRELISLSQNSWMSTRPARAPRHSAMKLNDGSDIRPVQTRLEQNPFLQLDKLAKIQSAGTLEQRHVTTTPITQTAEQTSPAHLNMDIKSSVAHAPSSPTISGMSVQMRIKIWAEKEQEAELAHSKLTHRRSLHATSSLFGINGDKEDGKPEGRKEVLECTAHSDDETIKNKSSALSEKIYPRTARENSYEIIDEKMERCRVEEASSSSSENTTPSKSPRKRKEKKGSLKASKKNSSPDINQKRKWKIKSPLQKRKNTVKKGSKEEIEVVNESCVLDVISKKTQCLSCSRKDVRKTSLAEGSNQEEEEVVDDVFSPVSQCSKKDLEQKLESENNIPDAKGVHGDCGVLPSVFDKVDTPPQPRPTKESRSISHEIFNIIDSLGTISENQTNGTSVLMPAPSLDIIGSNNSESGK